MINSYLHIDGLPFTNACGKSGLIHGSAKSTEAAVNYLVISGRQKVGEILQEKQENDFSPADS